MIVLLGLHCLFFTVKRSSFDTTITTPQSIMFSSTAPNKSNTPIVTYSTQPSNEPETSDSAKGKFEAEPSILPQENKDEKEKPDDGGLGGWICILGSFLAMFSSFGFLNAYEHGSLNSLSII